MLFPRVVRGRLLTLERVRSYIRFFHVITFCVAKIQQENETDFIIMEECCELIVWKNISFLINSD